jgi:hypothetical protein
MWQLENRTPFAADRTFIRDRDGREVLLVVVKATFALGDDGVTTVPPEQAAIVKAPVFAGDPARSSLVDDCDFALKKAKSDVLLKGHAHAVNGEPTIAVEARIRIGGWEKRIVVTGNRRWNDHFAGASLTDPEPFVKMPLVYERAFGGAGFDANPIGVGTPNLEDPNDLLTSASQRPRPMSFGPIPRSWPLRRRLAGTYDDGWRRERRPLLPADFDDAFWQSAPPDQQVDLHGGEAVELAGVSARGVLRFDLPSPAISIRTRIDGKVKKRTPSLQTVILEPDSDRIVLVYASALRCHHTLYTLEKTIVEETKRVVA